MFFHKTFEKKTYSTVNCVFNILSFFCQINDHSWDNATASFYTKPKSQRNSGLFCKLCTFRACIRRKASENIMQSYLMKHQCDSPYMLIGPDFEDLNQ